MFDLIIIGGGMVGATLACTLRHTPLKIALVDSVIPNSKTDPRLIALNFNSICLYKNLGVWDELKDHAAAIQEVHVSHRGRFGATRLKANEFSLPTLGYVVPAKIINEVLYKNLGKTSLFFPGKLTHLSQDNETVEAVIQLPHETKKLIGKILIGADGTHSTVRELLNFKVKKYDYRQSALVTVTQLKRSHHHVAYERFQDEGAIAMLPLKENCVATIWTDTSDVINYLRQLNDADFLSELQKGFGFRLGKLEKINQRFVFPLHSLWVDEPIKENVILMGNAAHTLHPIAAQGLNLALYEVGLLVDHFEKTKENIIPIASLSSSQIKMSQYLSHHLSHLFGKDFFVFNPLRQLGMIALDNCSVFKNFFAQRALGRLGTLPLLLREDLQKL